MRPALPLAVLVLLSGCISAPPSMDDWPKERPVGWDDTPELVPYNGFRAHSADQELDLGPPQDADVERPAGCAAYQNGKRSPYDTCAVGGPDANHGEEVGPWTIHAFWDGRGDDLIEEEGDETRRTVVAYDAEGNAVAHAPRAVAFAIE